MRDAAASPETVPRDIIDETIIQDTPERRLAVLGEIDEAYGRDVRAGATAKLAVHPSRPGRRPEPIWPVAINLIVLFRSSDLHPGEEPS